MNQCMMCTTLNDPSRKSCKHCKCRKYLRPCVSAEWRPQRNGGFYFYSGEPRDTFPTLELEYYNNTYRTGWCLFENEEFSPYYNEGLGPGDVGAAKNWALRIIMEHYRRNDNAD